MKKELREKYKIIRNKIKYKKNKNKKIEEKVINFLEKNSPKIVALYKSFSSEVSTDNLIEYLIQNGKIVILPRVEKNIINFYKIKNEKNNLIKNRFGIEEPIPQKDDLIESELIDLIIVPGLSFDRKKNRLGYGRRIL